MRVSSRKKLSFQGTKRRKMMMLRQVVFAALSLALVLPSTHCFSVGGLPVHGLRIRGATSPMALSMSAHSGRREAISLLVGTGLLAMGSKQVAAKEVGDGGLPPGLKELFNVLQAKKQWADIGKRVNDGHAEMDEKEWTNIQGYLRKLYGNGEDMLTVSRAFTKKEQDAVQEVVASFRKAVKTIDKPAAAKDWEAFMVQHMEITGYIARFFEIRSGKLDPSASNNAPSEI